MEENLSPLISVVIPTRQRPSLLMNRSLPSALAQSYSNLEVVVVVDGPDPETANALTELAQQDSRVRPVFLPHNMGDSDARNAGVEAARGEWIAFLDDDDEMLPHNLEQHLEAVAQAISRRETPLPVSICGSVTRTPGGDTPGPARLPDPGESVGDYMMARRTLKEPECGFMTSAIFCSRELLLIHPFRSGLPRQQDCDWALRASADPQVRFYFTQQVATIWYFGGDRRQITKTLHWPQSLAWVLESHEAGLVSGKALAGFVNGNLAPYARSHNQYRALLPLTRAMFTARPRIFEWLRFAFIWGVPIPVRQMLRRLRSRPAQPALIPEVPSMPPISQSATAYLPLPTHSSSVEKTG